MDYWFRRLEGLEVLEVYWDQVSKLSIVEYIEQQ